MADWRKLNAGGVRTACAIILGLVATSEAATAPKPATKKKQPTSKVGTVPVAPSAPVWACVESYPFNEADAPKDANNDDVLRLAPRLAARWRCAYDKQLVYPEELHVGDEDSMRRQGFSPEVIAGKMSRYRAVVAGLEQALTDAGDPCVFERLRVFAGLGADERYNSSEDTLSPWVVALWHCEKGAGKDPKRACNHSQAYEREVWLRIEQQCGGACNVDMSQTEACRWAYGTDLDEREKCTKRYQSAHDSKIKDCASFTCDDAKASLADDVKNIVKRCEENNEECWRWAERRKHELANCRGNTCGNPNYVPKGCEGWQKPCDLSEGDENLCTRARRPTPRTPHEIVRVCVSSLARLRTIQETACRP